MTKPPAYSYDVTYDFISPRGNGHGTATFSWTIPITTRADEDYVADRLMENSARNGEPITIVGRIRYRLA